MKVEVGAVVAVVAMVGEGLVDGGEVVEAVVMEVEEVAGTLVVVE